MSAAIEKPQKVLSVVADGMDELMQQQNSLAIAMDFSMCSALQILDHYSNFAGAIIAPSDDAKNALLDIPYQILNASGTKSQVSVSWMARQIQKKLRTDYGIGIVKNQDENIFWIALANTHGDVENIPVPFKAENPNTANAIIKAFQLLKANLNSDRKH